MHTALRTLHKRLAQQCCPCLRSQARPSSAPQARALRQALSLQGTHPDPTSPSSCYSRTLDLHKSMRLARWPRRQKHTTAKAPHSRESAPALRRRARLARPLWRLPCASRRAPRPPRRRPARPAPTCCLQRRQRRAPRAGPLRPPAPCLTALPRCRSPPSRKPPVAGRPGADTRVFCFTHAGCDSVVHLPEWQVLAGLVL
jgi:hypothetical protein